MAERLARTGIDPKLVGERVIDAIRNKTFYAFVSAVPADVIKARHRRIEAAGPDGRRRTGACTHKLERLERDRRPGQRDGIAALLPSARSHRALEI